MTDRRTFLKISALTPLAGTAPLDGTAPLAAAGRADGPVVVSTWRHGLAANEAAWAVLRDGGRALDAVEAGARVTEADASGRSVGRGGRPDRTGRVTLDASIMNERGDCGAVAFLEDILHPISVARRVMEASPHVLLVGEGARDFALAQGFGLTDLLTPETAAEWAAWRAENAAPTRPEVNVENHDTIGLLALDATGDLSGACTTSGAAWKLRGRVGDSPIVGAGLFVDNEVGAACATGWGEAVVRVVGSHLVVEHMRAGRTPAEACRLATERLVAKHPGETGYQVGFLALARDGRWGAYAVRPGFDAAVHDASGNHLHDVPSLRE